MSSHCGLRWEKVKIRISIELQNTWMKWNAGQKHKEEEKKANNIRESSIVIAHTTHARECLNKIGSTTMYICILFIRYTRIFKRLRNHHTISTHQIQSNDKTKAKTPKNEGMNETERNGAEQETKNGKKIKIKSRGGYKIGKESSSNAPISSNSCKYLQSHIHLNVCGIEILWIIYFEIIIIIIFSSFLGLCSHSIFPFKPNRPNWISPKLNPFPFPKFTSIVHGSKFFFF